MYQTVDTDIRESDLSDDQVAHYFRFLTLKFSQKNEFSGYVIKAFDFTEILKEKGIYRYDTADTYSLVRIENNVISRIEVHEVIDIFKQYIRDLPEISVAKLMQIKKLDAKKISQNEQLLDVYLTQNKLLSIFLDNADVILRPKALMFLKPDFDIEILEDTRKEKYFFFKNVFVIVTAEKIKSYDYTKLPAGKKIWKNQIIDREFDGIPPSTSQWDQFIRKVTMIPDGNGWTESEKRYKALKSKLGYLLHFYYSNNRYAITLTDSTISETGEANGRSGKTLIGKGLSHMCNTTELGKVYVEIPGREFKPIEEKKYARADVETNLIHINDVFKHFKVEDTFTDITEGMTVRQMHRDSFTIRANLLISTNKAFNILGDSAKDRVKYFEVANYFNAEYKPQDEFGTWFFSDDWDKNEWSGMDYFFIEAVQLYLSENIIQSDDVNLAQRIIQDNTSPEFISFMDTIMEKPYTFNEDSGSGYDQVFVDQIKPNDEFDKSRLYKQFRAVYKDEYNDKFTPHRFTKFLQIYAQNRGFKYRSRQTGGKTKITFEKK